ncbi:uncharacterized protein B0T23DRAFT_217250 [Neurospora hispaniola]|uniref:Uncharacterized protein n=1 Tax=Neurospora hispaniola TaxID=588809 RepID=A0AAJ0I2H6_9PEZI|nr:hypothetical protein B0T23DRAFT_217250 [Neurospora hispaniola]
MLPWLGNQDEPWITKVRVRVPKHDLPSTLLAVLILIGTPGSRLLARHRERVSMYQALPTAAHCRRGTPDPAHKTTSHTLNSMSECAAKCAARQRFSKQELQATRCEAVS